MGRNTCKEPETVSGLAVSGRTLSWTSQGEGMRYVVYKIADNKASIADIVTANSYTCTDAGSYAVTALNGDNRESGLSDIKSIKQ